MTFILDNSVSAAWFLEDEFDVFADQILVRLETESAIVPGIWVLEITNTLLAGFRRKRISEGKRTATFELLKSLPIAVEQNYAATDLDRLYRLGQTYNLSSYDAAYLDLSIRLDLPLATRDKDLRSAAKSASVKLLR